MSAVPEAAPDLARHWQDTWRRKQAEEVSWFQEQATPSLRWIRALRPDLEAPLVDIGGGASRLCDGLLDAGYRDLTVVDLAEAALARAQERLGPRASQVQWIAGDITRIQLVRSFALWHDRAAFHFLTRPEQRAAYVAEAARAVRPDGHLLIATFAEDGPLKCSGLEIVRYTPEALAREFGAAFSLLDSERETHRTPGGNEQRFQYCIFQKRRPS